VVGGWFSDGGADLIAGAVFRCLLLRGILLVPLAWLMIRWWPEGRDFLRRTAAVSHSGLGGQRGGF